MDTIESITKQIMDDPRDAEFTKRGEKPVFSAPSTALITIVGQSPSLDAQTRGLCWNDRSGDTLRKWLDVDKETFYDSGKFALVPMATCLETRAWRSRASGSPQPTTQRS